jgi:imidazole glycerol-phosphate synthase subunit HisH
MIAVIDYGAGNTFNVLYSLQQLGAKAILTNKLKELENADKIIFPGVGHAAHAINNLNMHGLMQVIPNLTQPVLGICLGMQLLYNSSAEAISNALQIIDGQVNKFNIGLPVPHMGWNNIKCEQNILFKNIKNADFYFVHSYFAPINKNTIATCQYQIEFCAAVQKNNFYGVQFHPEKSGDAGMELLKNFLSI